MNKVGSKFSIDENHPVMIKYNKLVQLAEELGISFTFYGEQCIIESMDKDGNVESFEVNDLEEDNTVNSFPHCMEVNIVKL